MRRKMRSAQYRYELAQKLQDLAGRLKGAIQQDDEWLYKDIFKELEAQFQFLKDELVNGVDLDEEGEI